MTADQRPGQGASVLDALPPTSSEISEGDYAIRSKRVFDNYSSTMSRTIPNLGRELRLTDDEGIEWSILASRHDGSVTSLLLSSSREVDGDMINSRAFLASSPYNSGAIGLKKLHEPEEVLGFVEKKMDELLAPIKAAQAAVTDALPRLSIDPEGERVLTVPPQNEGLGYWDDHP